MQEWTEKYRPRSLSDVRGNDKSVGELREWAETWEEHREAALVVGEPGVGKTSAVHALASDMGWSVVEQNASDSRTKDAIMEVAGEAARSQSLGGRRTLVVLDEADNLHGNADRGGSKALSEVLREAVQPVVLIGNEEREISGSLKRQTRKIEFGNVGKRSIVPVLRDVLESEGVSYDTGALDVIAEENSGDLRGALNDLQASAEGRSHLGVDDVDATGSRDRSEEIWGFLDVVFKNDDVGRAD
ncbi:MAG: AAA family ATPase [Halobacteriota archaeon]